MYYEYSNAFGTFKYKQLLIVNFLLAIAAAITTTPGPGSEKWAPILTPRKFWWIRSKLDMNRYRYIRVYLICTDTDNLAKLLQTISFLFGTLVSCRRNSKWKVGHWIWQPLTPGFWRFSTYFSCRDPKWTLKCNGLAWHVEHE